MNVLVTGASSYVGKYIISGLLTLDHNVIGTSRTDPNIDSNRFTWIKHDLSIKPIPLRGGDLDIIIHVAGLAWMGRNTSEYVTSNIYTTMNLVETIETLKPRVSFYISSRDVHGEITDNLITESTSIINPIMYGHTKYIAEHVLSECGPTVIFRVPSIIGVGTHGWIHSVYEKMVRDENIEYTDSRFNNIIHASEIPLIIQEFIDRSLYVSNKYVMGCSDVSSSKNVLYQMKRLTKSGSKLIEIQSSDSSYTMAVGKLCKIYQTMTVEQAIATFIEEVYSKSVK